MKYFGPIRALSTSMTVLVTALVAIVACGSSADDSPGGAGAGADASSTSEGGTSSGFQSSGDVPNQPFVPCVAQEAEAVEGRGPIDIIFLIDNSDSMSQEIAEVEKQINENFANVIAASNADYRIIMLTRHGIHDGVSVTQHVCVSAPLSGTNCTPPPAKPAETERFFHHNITIGSTDAFCRILTTFHAPDLDGSHPQGWGALLRPGAFKVFAIITDDRVQTACNGFTFDDHGIDPISGTTAAGTLESALYGLSSQFGSVARRNFIWHSIIGLAPFDANDLTKPHPDTSPIVTAKCTPDSVAPATGYQALSKRTGGLRYPTCGRDYTTIFRAMANDVIGKSVLPCAYLVPKPASGAIDPATAIVRYTSGTAVTDFEQVPNIAACGPNKFFIEGDRIKLCGDSCGTVQGDPAAQVKILFGCLPKQTN
jgi:hypothetical protein